VTSTAIDVPKKGSRKGELPILQKYINILGPLIMIILLSLIMLVFEPRFFRVGNIMVILQDAAIYMVLGMAMTIVISGKGIDLSIGAVAALSAIVMAILIKDYGVGPIVGMGAAIIVGVACGAVNGVIITKFKVPDLIATLASDLVFRGIALVLAAGTVLARFDEPIPFLGRGRLFEVIPFPAVIGVIALIIGYVIYHYTHLGRYATAIGGNKEAATLAGINVSRHKLYHYILMGGAAAAAGIMLTGKLNAIQATAGQGLALHTIAAVIVGGTILFGGKGTMLGTFVGVILLSMVTNALIILRFQFFWQLVASGVIIIAALAFYNYMQRRGSGTNDDV